MLRSLIASIRGEHPIRITATGTLPGIATGATLEQTVAGILAAVIRCYIKQVARLASSAGTSCAFSTVFSIKISTCKARLIPRGEELVLITTRIT